MRKFLNNILNKLVRDISYGWRVVIASAFLFLAIFALYKTIRRKNDSHPLAIGWLILFLVCTFISVIYFAL